MVPDHWSNDAMVSMNRCGLVSNSVEISIFGITYLRYPTTRCASPPTTRTAYTHHERRLTTHLVGAPCFWFWFSMSFIWEGTCFANGVCIWSRASFVFAPWLGLTSLCIRGGTRLQSQRPSVRVYGNYSLIIAVNSSFSVNNRTSAAAE